jgi:hypothetical protein
MREEHTLLARCTNERLDTEETPRIIDLMREGRPVPEAHVDVADAPSQR